MKITLKPIAINRTSIETGIWHIERCLIDKYGCGVAASDIAPLRWYIGTARAPLEFIHKTLNAKPFMIARKLHMGGSYDEAIQRVKDYLKMGDEL